LDGGVALLGKPKHGRQPNETKELTPGTVPA
jgi:hypothetical protein